MAEDVGHDAFRIVVADTIAAYVAKVIGGSRNVLPECPHDVGLSVEWRHEFFDIIGGYLEIVESLDLISGTPSVGGDHGVPPWYVVDFVMSWYTVDLW